MDRAIKSKKEGRKGRRASFFFRLRLHPTFLLMGVWYACTGELFLFLISALVALQHECAHAFAAAKLGYKLKAVVLMPYGAVIDGDLSGISLKDEIFVALCGPLCNFVTALFFMALWWFAPVSYPFTDVAYYSSLTVALVNLLPCYPLDGGRVLRCLLARGFFKRFGRLAEAERAAGRLCKGITLFGATALLLVFLFQAVKGKANFSLLAFGIFLLVGGLGGKGGGNYEKMDIHFLPNLKKGVEIRRVAVSSECTIKDVFPFLTRGSYLVLEVYGKEGKRFELPQNRLAEYFARAETPYERIGDLYERKKSNGFL